MPGFGKSDGTRDCTGPHSQKAIAAVVDHFSELPFIDAKRMGIYGISKGASLASMIHIYNQKLLFQVLEAGCYDFTTRYALLPDYLADFKTTMLIETDGSEQALRDRSAVFHTHSVQSKTLILLGEFDDRRNLPSSVALYEKLLAAGKECQFKIFPNELHCLSESKWDFIIPFVRQQFFDLYGIGANVTLIPPAVQVAKILPNSPAQFSGKLKVGDVILRAIIAVSSRFS